MPFRKQAVEIDVHRKPRVSNDPLEEVCEGRSLAFMAYNIPAVNTYQPDAVSAKSLGGLCMVERGVSVSLPNSFVLAALLPISGLRLDCLVQCNLRIIPDLKFSARQRSCFFKEIKQLDNELEVFD